MINWLILLFPLTFQPSAIFNHIRRIPSSKPWTSHNDVLNVAPRQIFTKTKKKSLLLLRVHAYLFLFFLVHFPLLLRILEHYPNNSTLKESCERQNPLHYKGVRCGCVSPNFSSTHAHKNHGLVTVKPLLSGHLRDLPKGPHKRGCPLNRVCKYCAMFVDDRHSTVALYCDKAACC